MNWRKTEALWAGQWQAGLVPPFPGGLQWGRNGLKVLGVCLGSTDFQEKNCEGIEEKVCA